MSLRNSVLGIGVGLTLLWGSVALGAVVTDTWLDPNGDILLDLSDSDQPIAGVHNYYAYEHDITDDGFNLGHSITSAILYVTVRDSGGAEAYQYEIGLGPEQTSIFSNVPNNRIDEIVFAPLSLADLQLDGMIGIAIRITDDTNNQDGLYFVSSSLVAQVESTSTAPAQVPAPGTLALLGLALAGLSFSRRKRAIQ